MIARLINYLLRAENQQLRARAEAEAKRRQEAGQTLVAANTRHFNEARQANERAEKMSEALNRAIGDLIEARAKAAALEVRIKAAALECREALDSLPPEAPENGRPMSPFHAGCCVLRAWAPLATTGDKYDQIAVGHDFLEALSKAEKALRTIAGKMQTIAEGDHAWLFMESNVWGDIPDAELAELLTSQDARDVIAAAQAIEALGVRGGT